MEDREVCFFDDEAVGSEWNSEKLTVDVVKVVDIKPRSACWELALTKDWRDRKKPCCCYLVYINAKLIGCMVSLLANDLV